MTTVTPATAAKIARSARKIEQERARLASLIRSAHEDGASLRTIAEAAGLSHETVRRIVAAG